MHTVAAPSTVADAAARSGSSTVARVAVAGATGYTGQELLRLLARHPAVAHHAWPPRRARRRPPGGCRRSAGSGTATITPLEPALLAREADVVFLALPDTAAAELAPGARRAGRPRHRPVGRVPAARRRGARRAGIRRRTTCPPAWPTGSPNASATPSPSAARRQSRLLSDGSLLALAPLADAGLLVPGRDIIIDAKSGVSGAGKTPSERTHFSEVHGSLSAYGVFGHRHGAEIEQGLGRQVTFTPHLVPLDRGILATIYVRVPGHDRRHVGDIYSEAYGSASFVRLVGTALPEIKHVAHTNFCDIGWRVDPSGRAILVSVIDNLLKGASGQAVQNMNVMLGLPEATGLL